MARRPTAPRSRSTAQETTASSAPDAAAERERRHPGQDESFTFDFWTIDGSVAGFAALTLVGGGAWYWAALVGDGRPYVLVKELDVAAPRQPGSLEIRAEGLWADHNCESPFEHWSIGLEAFGVALPDPEEALRSEWGERTALGFDLEFEMGAGEVAVAGDEVSYEQLAVVHGVVLVGVAGRVETIELDGRGRRGHRRGAVVPPGGAAPAAWRHRAPIRLDDAVLDRWLVDGTTGWTDTVTKHP